HHVYRLALGQQRAVLVTSDFIAEVQERSTNLYQPRPDDHQIVVAGRRLVAAAYFYHGEVHTATLLHLAISESELAHHLHPADFEPDDEVRVLDHSHLVGLGVADAHFGLVHLWSGRCLQ